MMTCPRCSSYRTVAKGGSETGPTYEGDAVLHRRVCNACSHQWRTVEIDLDQAESLGLDSLVPMGRGTRGARLTRLRYEFEREHKHENDGGDA